MKLLLRSTTTRTLLQQPRLPTTPTVLRNPALRAFSNANPLRLKEDKERSGEELERQKQENLKKNEWNRELASSSEEAVGADQQKVKDHDKHMDELQKETAQKSEEKHPEGKS